MSEEKKVIYCTQCGKENDSASKFCSNCGTKLEQSTQHEGSASSEGIFSGYEKITDAEEVKPTSNPYQEEIKINYSSDGNNYSGYNNSYYDSQQYYSGESDAGKSGGGNIGFAIASLVCGIISMLCCCLTLFSALLGIAAIVLGVITLCFKYDGKAMAIAGIATGGAAIALVIMAMILRSAPFYREMVDEIIYEFY